VTLKLGSLTKRIGYPIMVKASAGGGGKGMRLVRKEEDFKASLRMARSEARSAFGDDSVYIENSSSVHAM